MQREQVLALATNFPQLWNDPGTADRERKRMVRLLIEDVTIRKGQQVQLDVRFRGGMSKTLMLPRAELLREPQAKSAYGSRNGSPLGRLQLCRCGSNSQREGGIKQATACRWHRQPSATFEQRTGSRVASVGFVN